MTKWKLFILTLWACGASAFAQVQPYTYYPLDKQDTAYKKWELRVYDNSCIRNNEYFGPFTKGITYIGTVMQPEIRWSPEKNFRISVGGYFLAFSGKPGFYRALPVLRAEYRFKPVTLILGSLYGDLHHGFAEPLYCTDHYFNIDPENGIQTLWHYKGLQADVFMNWMKFILPGDNSQEEIMGGLVLRQKILQKTSHHLDLLVQGLIHHYGGQVDITDNLLQSRANAAIGLQYSYPFQRAFVQKVSFEALVISSMELSQKNTLPYESGYALYPGIALSSKYIDVDLHWFNGKYFFAPMGEYLFQSVSSLNNWYIADTRNVVCPKLGLHYELAKGIRAGVVYESYYDVPAHRNEFSYGINLAFDGRVL